MTRLFTLLIFTSFFLNLVSCSKFKSVKATPKSDTSEAELFVEAGDGEEDLLNEDDPAKEIEENLLEEEPLLKEEMVQEKPMIRDDGMGKQDMVSQYQIKKGDTLMIISYKLYGHHKQWKNLLAQNRGVIKNYRSLSAGTMLSFNPPSVPPTIPGGLPYLIKMGDSLSLIAGKVYGDIMKWKPIHQNNSREITNPNLIFAGFTIYYPEKDQQIISQN
jgi:nucleoid-associated protein YgaU